MKNVLLLSFFFLILGIGMVCSLSEQNNAILVSSEVLVQDTADFPLIDLWQDSIWEAIELDWRKNNFESCLKAAKLKISCGSCTSLFMDVIFYVNSEGRLEKHEITRSKFCKKETIEKCLMDYFFNLNFPEQYRNTSFKTRLGKALKC